MRTTPKVVGGLTDACRERAVERLLGRSATRSSTVSSPEAAELTKLLENIFRSVNIALVNELAQLCDRMGIDVWEVVDAAATKPFGFMRFEPGPGMGGHCLPVDPFYLAFKAREHDFPAEFIELAGKLNQSQPHFCVERIVRALNDVGKPAHGSRVLLLGVSYKAGVADMRESPALKIVRLLRELGAEVAYHDPHVPSSPSSACARSISTEALAELRRRLHRHRPRRDRLRARRRRGAARRRLPRRHPRHRGREPGPALRCCGARHEAKPPSAEPTGSRSALAAARSATAGTVIGGEFAAPGQPPRRRAGDAPGR